MYYIISEKVKQTEEVALHKTHTPISTKRREELFFGAGTDNQSSPSALYFRTEKPLTTTRYYIYPRPTLW